MISLRGCTIASMVPVLLVLLYMAIFFAKGPVTTEDTTTTGSSDKEEEDDSMVVKVFILAGQSNMVGKGSIEHLNELINMNNAKDDYDECNANEYCKDLWDMETNSFKIRQNVFINFNNRVYGNLTVGNRFAYEDRFGPELGFGWVVGGGASASPPTTDQPGGGARKLRIDQPPPPQADPIIYIIKAAYGGKTLAVDFRPPSSGEGDYNNVKANTSGLYYREMITSITDGLDQIANVIPGYNGSSTSRFEIVGFVWFQGWNDSTFMPYTLEYEYNLINFLRDVRKDLDLPNLPIVVGELGQGGDPIEDKSAEKVYIIRAAQKAATLLPEFLNSSQFVPTAPHVVKNNTNYEEGYHYNGRADTFYHIGKDFGRAMLTLLAKNEV